MKRMPSLAATMTPFPHSIAADKSLQDARHMMEEHDVRHLPVTKDGALVGIVSQRDLAVAQAAGGADDMPLGSVYIHFPYVVDIRTRLDLVVKEMAGRRIGSALVTRNGKPVGIVTHSDIAKLLGDMLIELFPIVGDDEPA